LRQPDCRAPDPATPSDESGTERDFLLEIKMLSIFRRIMKNEQGATAIEYTLIASLIAVAAITAMSTVGGKVTNVLTNVGNAMT
jgi:pilus assembly protein Flp/PilA